MTVTVQKWGNSHGVRIPKIILDEIHWKENESLEIRTESDKIIIERTTRRKNIKELFADYHGEYTPVKIDWGNPRGKEIW